MGESSREEIFEKVVQKKEFSDLPRKDVEFALNKFYRDDRPDFQIIKLTRNFLRKIYSSFSSHKLLNSNYKSAEWVLMKHKSTKERYNFYEDIYDKLLRGYNNSKTLSIIDLGSGVNGFSFEFLRKINKNVEYVGVEAIGQLGGLTNSFFKKNNFQGRVEHISLFDWESLEKIISNQKKPCVVFLFKVIDSLESMERNYSKELLKNLVPLVDRVVVSFATRSLGDRKKFSVQRGWLLKFIRDNFNLADDFELGGERYLVLES